MARSKGSPWRSQSSASFGEAVARREHAPTLGLEREDAPVGGVVVHDQDAAAAQLRLLADEVRADLQFEGGLREDGEMENGTGSALGFLADERARHGRRFDPHRAPHHLGQPPADGQAQAGAAVLACGGGIHLAEGLEQAADAVCRDADAGVADRKVDRDGRRR